jgi:hypothetical protein
MLGNDKPLKWSEDDWALTAEFPVAEPCQYAFILELSGNR